MSRNGEPNQEAGAQEEGTIFRMTYQKLDKSVKRKYSILFFSVVFVTAFLVISQNNALRGIWGVAGSIACPLIVCVLPGCFYYYVRKDTDVDTDKCPKKYFGLIYAIMGLLLLPIFLTLSTKSLFSATDKPDPDDPTNALAIY